MNRSSLSQFMDFSAINKREKVELNVNMINSDMKTCHGKEVVMAKLLSNSLVLITRHKQIHFYPVTSK